MSELPERPHLDPLRSQARELLRAADAGDPEAIRRLGAVSDQRTLSAALLAIAREYGFPSWPALHAEVGRRRSATVPAAGELSSIPAVLAPAVWSLGGPAVIEAAAGTLSFSVVLVGAEHALAEASLQLSADAERQLAGPQVPRVPGARFLSGALSVLARRQRHWPNLGFGDVTVADDRGRPYSLAVQAMSLPREIPGRRRGPVWLRLRLDPVPPTECSWIDLHGPGGPVTRLLPSPRPRVRVTGSEPAAGTEADRELARRALHLLGIRLDIDSGPDRDAGRGQFPAGEIPAVLSRADELREQARLSEGTDLPGHIAQLADVLASGGPAEDLPGDWAGILSAASATDGPSRTLDLAAYVAAPDGVGVQLDTLVSEPAGWRVHLRAAPGWWEVSEDQQHKRDVLFVTAEDDRGGMYISSLGAGSGHHGHYQLALTFRPRLSPKARALRLTFTGRSERATALITLTGT